MIHMTASQDAKHILLIDDNDEMRKTVTMGLEEAKYIVHTAGHGLEGLRVLQQLIPDLILSDINMPGMDGIQFYAALKSDPRWTSIPIIFLTANEHFQTLESWQNLGAEEEILVKPFDLLELLSRIRARLEASVPAGQRPH